MPSVHVGLGNTWLWPLVRKRAKPAQSIAITRDPDGTLCTYEVYSTEERRGTPQGEPQSIATFCQVTAAAFDKHGDGVVGTAACRLKTQQRLGKGRARKDEGMLALWAGSSEGKLSRDMTVTGTTMLWGGGGRGNRCVDLVTKVHQLSRAV